MSATANTYWNVRAVRRWNVGRDGYVPIALDIRLASLCALLQLSMPPNPSLIIHLAEDRPTSLVGSIHRSSPLSGISCIRMPEIQSFRVTDAFNKSAFGVGGGLMRCGFSFSSHSAGFAISQLRQSFLRHWCNLLFSPTEFCQPCSIFTVVHLPKQDLWWIGKADAPPEMSLNQRQFMLHLSFSSVRLDAFSVHLTPRSRRTFSKTLRSLFILAVDSNELERSISAASF